MSIKKLKVGDLIEGKEIINIRIWDISVDAEQNLDGSWYTVSIPDIKELEVKAITYDYISDDDIQCIVLLDDGSFKAINYDKELDKLIIEGV